LVLQGFRNRWMPRSLGTPLGERCAAPSTDRRGQQPCRHGQRMGCRPVQTGSSRELAPVQADQGRQLPASIDVSPRDLRSDCRQCTLPQTTPVRVIVTLLQRYAFCEISAIFAHPAKFSNFSGDFLSVPAYGVRVREAVGLWADDPHPAIHPAPRWPYGHLRANRDADQATVTDLDRRLPRSTSTTTA
jgi:hypothetical protein